MKNTIILFTIFISSILGVSAQVNLDSLWTVWNDPNQPDTSRLKAMHKIAWNGYIYSQPDSAFYFAQLQYDYAKDNGFKKQMANALNTQGVSFWVQSNYASAIDYYTRSLAINEQIGDKNGIANSLNNIGVAYYEQGAYASAIDYYTRSLVIGEEIGDKSKIANSLGNIGLIYKNQGDYAKAIDYHTRCLTIKEEIGDKEGIAATLNNIGILHDKQGNQASAIDYYRRSLAIREEIRDKKGILNNIGEIYSGQGNYDSAISHYTRSLAIKKDIGDKKGIAGSLFNIGEIFYKQGDYTSAIKYSSRSLRIAQEIGAIVETSNAANALYESYKATGKPTLALEMNELYISMKDSIANEENQREVIRQEYKYKYEKQAIADSIRSAQEILIKEALISAEIYKNKRKQQQAYFLYGGIIVLVIFLIILYNSFHNATKQKKIVEMQKLLVDKANNLLIEKNREIQTQADKINEINEEINKMNESLEETINERTIRIKVQNLKLREYAFSNSHKVRAPLARLMGLTNLWDLKNVTEEERNFIMEKISQSAFELDEIVKEVSVMLNENEEEKEEG